MSTTAIVLVGWNAREREQSLARTGLLADRRRDVRCDPGPGGVVGDQVPARFSQPMRPALCAVAATLPVARSSAVAAALITPSSTEPDRSALC
jgi:hypothetical protein